MTDALPLDLVRRLETAALSAWPAERVSHDGSWLFRHTAGHASRRLNSLNFLDPADGENPQGRLEAMAADYVRDGGSMIVRVTPLTPPGVTAVLDRLGWTPAAETITMTIGLAQLDGAVVAAASVMDEGPRSAWATAMRRTGSAKVADPAALVALLGRIVPEAALSVVRDRHTGQIAATALAVADRGLVGLFDVGTVAALRRRGYGRSAVLAALAWGYAHGARLGYLQVEAANTRAVSLYHQLGFTEVYRGEYRLPPQRPAREDGR